MSKKRADFSHWKLRDSFDVVNATHRTAYEVQRDIDDWKAADKARHQKTAKRISRPLLATALVVAGAAAEATTHVVQDTFGKKPIPVHGEAPKNMTPVAATEQTPLTIHVFVNKKNAGINSTVQDAADEGLIDAEHVPEYKKKALEMHGNDPNVILGSGLDIPVDHLPVTDTVQKPGE